MFFMLLIHMSNFVSIRYYLCEARRFQRFRPIPFQAQGPRRGGRSARRRMKGIQTAIMYCRGRPCPRQAKITGEEGATSPEAIPLRIPKEIPSPTGQPQEHGRKATPGEAVTSVLNTHSYHLDPIDVDVTPGQCDGGRNSSQSARKSG